MDGVDSVIVPQHTVDGCAPVALATLELLADLPRHETVEKRSYLHVLGDV